MKGDTIQEISYLEALRSGKPISQWIEDGWEFCPTCAKLQRNIHLKIRTDALGTIERAMTNMQAEDAKKKG